MDIAGHTVHQLRIFGIGVTQLVEITWTVLTMLDVKEMVEVKAVITLGQIATTSNVLLIGAVTVHAAYSLTP